MAHAGDGDAYVYDEASGEWISPEDAAARSDIGGGSGLDVRDANGTPLANGDSVVLIKDLKVKGAGQTLKRGTLVKTIRLTDDPEEIDCRTEGIKGLVLRTEFVKKR
jgi:protein PhnA